MSILSNLTYYNYFKDHTYIYPRMLWQLVQKALGRNNPLMVEIFMETRCNYTCWHCSSSEYINKGYKGLANEDLDLILKKLKPVGTLAVTYVGGEPLLRKDIEKVIELTCRYKMLPSIITNACLLTESRIDSLFRSGLANMSFSLHSMKSEIHDELVNCKGAYAKMMGAMHYCIAKRYPCAICVVPTNENMKNGDFKNMMQFSLDNKIRVNMNLPAPIGKLLNNKEILLDKESLAALMKDYMPLPSVIPDFKQNFMGRVVCPIGFNAIYILPDGEVCPCTFVHISFGNILKEPIEVILKRLKGSSFIRNIKRDGQCPVAMDRDFINMYSELFSKSKIYPPRWTEL